MQKSLTIGRVADLSSVNVETIRYYQRFGILNEPIKPTEGYRIYPAETINRIRFIKRAQQLGFSLKEISQLLDLGNGRCADVVKHAEEKRNNIAKQIIDLNKLHHILDELISACHNEKDTSHCPIVETLTA